ncbi:unnamed protein product [Nippostrongylus brasiliensis]|uniref:G_PROTEIN_RECEP_F1_2 domain-containing protein n=1 Tax=Nippostrongylus brasiliensis TaxID=27835 RepID=A0A158QX97_NIPBR|nr:unnamed protein product [Nippostrongylus brasiliensis]
MAAVEFRRHREPALLWTISVRSITAQCMVLPIAAVLLAFACGSVLHPSELYWYQWTCGYVRLPSVSRVINLPLERTIFQLLVMFSVPFRAMALLKQWLQFSIAQPPLYFSLAKVIMVISSVVDLIFISALSTIGERESGGGSSRRPFCRFRHGHVRVFRLHLFVDEMGQQADTVGKYRDILKEKLQLTFLSCISVTIPVILVLFVLYNGYCVEYRSWEEVFWGIIESWPSG